MSKKHPKKVIKLYANGTKAIVADAKVPPLEVLQKHVGGYIEIHNCLYEGVKARMVMNEDGRSKGLQLNKEATLAMNQNILGDVWIFIGFRSTQI